MANKEPLSIKMRVIHRYLGFFLAGVMAMYAISGIVLIFRNNDTFKQEIKIEQTVAAELSGPALGQAIKFKNLKFTRTEGDMDYFDDGSYNRATGEVTYSKKELPFVLDKLTHLHKATTKDPLYFLNIFFGLSLLFFVISAFWMYMPGGKILRKGLLFTAGGIILILIMLFV
ncbi:PepSY domain-containing protein [Neolewinella persica]|uniref:PepSY domain-containing protein n=1 Tax=Neolewinella persica TaxID=70998 RepID=UPI00047619D6|nr:PepSY domain-containing protein [Neolewinella persica]